MKTIGREQLRFTFDKADAPEARVSSGESVRFLCQDCYNGQLAEDGQAYETMDMDFCNPVSGPLYVEGAEPGDVLKVTVREILLTSPASMCVRLGSGVYEVPGCHCRRFSLRDGYALFDEGIRIPLKPMVGVMGVCPAGEAVTTLTPGEHGGNLDIRDLHEGSEVYLPVAVPGALLSMGDLHAVQGDGETAVCALECAGEVTVRVDVIKTDAYIPTPMIVTYTHFITAAAHESLDVCSVEAARKMHKFLTAHSPLPAAEAAMLLSLRGNLRISQVVNPKKGCIMEFPRDAAPIQWNY